MIVPDVEHNSKDENAQSGNVFIAGDNLDCLKHLENAYTGKVDVIYIDPPYNTGGDGFVYADNFKFSDEQLQEKLGLTENEVARVRALTGKSSHSAWLTFMYPRLVIAKRLLKDTGVIFVSIDDNEQANLKLLMDEVFGEGNFYGQIIQKKGSTQNDSETIQRNCDYHLVYSKRRIEGLTTYDSVNERQLYENRYFLGRDTGSSSGHDKLTDRNNLGYTVYYWEGNQNGATGNNNKLTDRNNLGYTVYYWEGNQNGATGNNNKLTDRNNPDYYGFSFITNGDKVIHAIALMDYDITNLNDNSRENEIYTDDEFLIELGYTKIRPPERSGGKLGCWTWGLNSFKEKWNNNEVLIKNNKNIIQKVFIDSSVETIEKNGRKYAKIIQKLPLQNILDNFSSSNGTTQFNAYFPENNKLFTNPKNTDMLKWFIQSTNNTSALILDFFAGSATTADAVMQLNKEDGGNRKYILCTLDESVNEKSEAKKAGYTTIDEISRERIKRAAEKIGDKSGFKSYYLKTPTIQTLDKIDEFVSTEGQLIPDDMISPFSAQNLNLENTGKESKRNQADGKDTILTTWLIDDGFDFATTPEELTLGDGKETAKAYKTGQRLYILDENWGTNATTDLLNRIGKNELHLQTIIIYAYSLQFEALTELKTSLKTNLDEDHRVEIIERY